LNYISGVHANKKQTFFQEALISQSSIQYGYHKQTILIKLKLLSKQQGSIVMPNPQYNIEPLSVECKNIPDLPRILTSEDCILIAVSFKNDVKYPVQRIMLDTH
jgi:hypothetical protein